MLLLVCTLYIIHLQCTVYILHYTVYSVYCKLYTFNNIELHISTELLTWYIYIYTTEHLFLASET